MKKYTCFILFICLIFTPHLWSSDLGEAYIFLRVAKYKGNKFYKVLVNENENPYLDLEEILRKYFDFSSVSCDLSNKYCSGVLNPDKITYWIDFSSLTFGNSKSKESTKFPTETLIIQEDKIWLRQDIWRKWIPVEITWDLNTYFLSLNPKFPLLYQRKEELYLNRKSAISSKKEKSHFKKMKSIKNGNGLFAHGRYKLSVEKNINNNFSNPTLKTNIQTKIDVLKGTLTLDGTYARDIDNGIPLRETYWYFNKFNTYGIHLIEAGYITLEKRGAFIPTFNLTNGMKVVRIKKGISSGLIDIEGRAIEGSEVDIFHNGILHHSQRVGSDGKYIVKDIFVSGGDYLKTTILMPDGTEQTKLDKISFDNSLIIPTNKFDFTTSAGKTEDNHDIIYGNIRYGLINNLSMGAHILKKDDSFKNPAALADIAWRLLPSTLLYYETFISSDNYSNQYTDNAVGLNLNIGEYNFFQFKFLIIEDNSPVLFNKELVCGKSYNLYHKFSYYNYLWEGKLKEQDKIKFLSMSLTKVFNRKFNISIRHQPKIIDGAYYSDLSSAQISYFFSRQNRVILKHQIIGEHQQGLINYQFKSQNEKLPFSLNSGIIFNDKSNLKTTFNLNWQLNKNILLTLNIEDTGVAFKIAFADVFSSNNSHISNLDEYGSGTIFGKVNMPSNKNISLANMVVQADGRKVKTDKNGFFRITGVPAYKEIKVSIDQSSIDITLSSPKEGVKVYLRPTSSVEVNLELISSIGIDGVIKTTNKIPPQVMIQVQEENTEKIIQTALLEYDGFFVIENLPSGKYKLSLTGLPKNMSPPRPKHIELKTGMDWLSNIEWEW